MKKQIETLPGSGLVLAWPGRSVTALEAVPGNDQVWLVRLSDGKAYTESRGAMVKIDRDSC